MEHLKRDIRMFLISNKEEFAFERKILHEVAVPQIRKYCLTEFNTEFNILDPHLELPGVQNPPCDITDHMQFIKDAHEISNGVSCMVFFGEKFDGPFAPRKLPAQHYQGVLDALKSKNDPLWMMFQKKYSQIPNTWPSMYKLQVTGLSAEEDEQILLALKTGCEKAIASGTLKTEEMVHYFQSDLERYLQCTLAERVGAEQTIAVFRNVHDIASWATGTDANADSDTNLRRFLLDVDASGAVRPDGLTRLEEFREAVKKRMPRENWTRYELSLRLMRDLHAASDHNLPKSRQGKPPLVRSLSDDQLNPEMSLEEYGQLLSRDYVERLKYHITRLLRRWEFYADPLFREVELHRSLLERIADPPAIVQREREMKILETYLGSTARTPGLLVGEPGCGKSLLLKVIQRRISELMPRQRPVLALRCAGHTSGASSLQQLLTSLTAQICSAFKRPASGSCEYAVCVYDFWRALQLATARKPIILLLDDAERLYPLGHTELFRWLPHRLPPYVKVLVTTSSEGITSGFKRRFDESSAITIPSLDAATLFNNFSELLTDRGKQAEEKTMETANHWLQQNSTPVYAHLLADILPVEEPDKLSDRIKLLFSKRIEQLERAHPPWVIRFLLCYLASARFGLTLLELHDILCLDNFLVQESKFDMKRTNVFRLPLQFVTMIMKDLEPYLVTVQIDDRYVYTFRHEAFRGGIIEHYQLGKEFGTHIHQSLADYWQGRYGGDGKSKPLFDKTMETDEGLTINIDRQAPAQPYYWAKDIHAGEVICNARKLAELPFQLLRAERLGDLFKYALFCYEYIYAKLVLSSVNDLIAEMYFVRQAYEIKTNQELDILISLLRLLQSTLERDPDLLGPELVGRLSHLVGSQGLFTMLHQQIDLYGPKVNVLIPTIPCYPTVDADEIRVPLSPCEGNIISAMSPDNRYITTLFPSSGDIILTVWDAKSATKMQIINLGPMPDLQFQRMYYMPQRDDHILVQYTDPKNTGYLCINVDIATVENKFVFPLDARPEILYLAKSYVTIRVGGVPKIFLHSNLTEVKEFKDLAWPFIVTPSDKYAVAPRQPKSASKELSNRKVDHNLRLVSMTSGENLCIMESTLPTSFLMANVRNEVLFAGARSHGMVFRYDIGQVAKRDLRRLKPSLELMLEITDLPEEMRSLYEKYRPMTSVTSISLSIDEKYLLVDFNISEIKHICVVWQLSSKQVTAIIPRLQGDEIRFSTDGTHVYQFMPHVEPSVAIYAVNSGDLVLQTELRARIHDVYLIKGGGLISILPTEVILTTVNSLSERASPEGDQVQGVSTSLVNPRYNSELNVVFSNDLHDSNFTYFNLDTNTMAVADMAHTNPSITRFPIERHIAPDGSKLILVYGSRYFENMRRNKRTSVSSFMMNTGSRGNLIQDQNDFRKPEIPGVNYFTGYQRNGHMMPTEMYRTDGVYEQRILRVFDTAVSEVVCQISLTGERVLQMTNKFLLTFKPDYASLTRDASNASDIVSIYDVTTGEYVNSTYLDHPVITSVLVDNNSKLLVSCGKQGRWIKVLGGKMLDQVLNKVDIETIMKYYDEYARSVNIRYMFVFPDNINAVLLSYFWKEPDKEIYYAKIDLNKKDVISQFPASDHIQDVTRDGKFGVDRGLRLYDLTKGEVIRQLTTASAIDNENFSCLPKFTEDGAYIVVLDNVDRELSVIRNDVKAHVVGKAPLHRIETSLKSMAPFDLELGQGGRTIVVHNSVEFKVFVLRDTPKGKRIPDPSYHTLAERSRYLMPGKRISLIEKMMGRDKSKLTGSLDKKDDKKDKGTKRTRNKGKSGTPSRENTNSPAVKKT